MPDWLIKYVDVKDIISAVIGGIILTVILSSRLRSLIIGLFRKKQDHTQKKSYSASTYLIRYKKYNNNIVPETIVKHLNKKIDGSVVKINLSEANEDLVCEIKIKVISSSADFKEIFNLLKVFRPEDFEVIGVHHIG
jgi:hypothetical protein